jgi:hypothetical protein
VLNLKVMKGLGEREREKENWEVGISLTGAKRINIKGLMSLGKSEGEKKRQDQNKACNKNCI